MIRCLVLVLGATLFAVLPPASGSPDSQTKSKGQDLHERALSLQQKGEYLPAASIEERALSLLTIELGSQHIQVAVATHTLASIYDKLGRFQPAEQLYLRAIQLFEENLGRDHLQVADFHNNVGGFYAYTKQPAKAEPHYQQALKIQEAKLDPRDPKLGQAFSNLGRYYQDSGQLDKASPLLERGLRIWEESLGRDHRALLPVLIALAAVRLSQGQDDRARKLLERAMGTATAHGERHAQVKILSLQARIEKKDGDLLRTCERLETAIRIYKQLPDAEDLEVANLLHLLSSARIAARQFVVAESAAKEALRLREQRLGRNHPSVARALAGLAAVYQEENEYGKARPLLERAIRCFEAAGATEKDGMAGALNNLGMLYWQQNEQAQALQTLERSARMYDDNALSLDPQRAVLHSNLAGFYQQQKNYSQAEPHYRLALQLRQAALGPGHPGLINLLARFATLRAAQGNVGSALELFTRATDAALGFLRKAETGTDLALYYKVLGDLEDQVCSFAVQHPDELNAARLAMSMVLLYKGRIAALERASSGVGLRQFGDPLLFERMRQLTEQRAELARLYHTPRDKEPRHGEKLLQVEAEVMSLEDQLARASAHLQTDAFPSRQAILRETAHALPPDGALIELVDYKFVDFRNHPPELDTRALAFILLPDGQLTLRSLGQLVPIVDAAVRLRNALKDRRDDAPDAGLQIHKLVMAPLVSAMKSQTRLFISADGILNLVPFAAFHDGKDFAISRYRFTYLDSGRDLLLRHASGMTPGPVAVLANADFGGSIQPLPGTVAESQAISHLFPQASLLLGKAATKQALLHVTRPRILHLATHGEYQQSTHGLRRSSILTKTSDGKLKEIPIDELQRPDSGTSVTGKRGAELVGMPAPARSASDNALMVMQTNEGELRIMYGSMVVPMSVLGRRLPPKGVMAGASLLLADAGRGTAKGRLTALEVASLDLSATELVVLSACETGVGEISAGQGVYGLRRAFLTAGTQTLVASLWQVADASTSRLMSDYYRGLNEGQGRGDAMHAAILSLRQRYPHPYYWAPFIVIGDPSPLPHPTAL